MMARRATRRLGGTGRITAVSGEEPVQEQTHPAHLMGRLPEWLRSQVFARKETYAVGRYGDTEDRLIPTTITAAHLITSLGADGLYRPMIDLDVRHWYKPSTSDGHAHLVIDRPLTKRQCNRLMKALARAGVIETGFYRSGRANRYGNALRLPWIRKESE